MFFTYMQNNSGGTFVVDENLGHYVIIEAETEWQADAKAEDLGVYFDGCADGRDCDCCGDRWYSAAAGTKTPKIYDTPAGKFWRDTMKEHDFMACWCSIRIHYRTGRVRRYESAEDRA
jgi:hypothetical protein